MSNFTGRELQLRRGNTKLLESLMSMVDQFFYEGKEGVLYHAFMSAEEHAIEVLIDAKMAEECEGGYRLLWDALEERKAADVFIALDNNPK